MLCSEFTLRVAGCFRRKLDTDEITWVFRMLIGVIDARVFKFFEEALNWHALE